MVWKLLYNMIGIPLAFLVRSLLMILNKKYRSRESTWKELLDKCPTKFNNRIWVHAASMGEFEQVKPVIEFIKSKDPKVEIIVSFYSPSGYDNQKNYSYADHILYMPFDSLSNVNRFINKVSPDIALFVRYEYWFNHLNKLSKKQIPSYLICATRPSSRSFYFPMLQGFFKSMLNNFYKIITVGEEHTEFFENMNYKGKLETGADTRFDRILEKVESKKELPIKKNSFKYSPLMVAGSTWPEDEQLIADVYEKYINKISVMIVPHEPTESHIERTKKYFPNALLLSEIENGRSHNGEVVIVDSIGKLLGLYSIADIAYVGGAFGTGVHSVTEPAGYGMPVITGPGMYNSPDAPNLYKLGSLKVVSNFVEFEEIIEYYLNDNNLKKDSDISRQYILDGKGWSVKIGNDILSTLDHI